MCFFSKHINISKKSHNYQCNLTGYLSITQLITITRQQYHPLITISFGVYRVYGTDKAPVSVAKEMSIQELPGSGCHASPRQVTGISDQDNMAISIDTERPMPPWVAEVCRVYCYHCQFTNDETSLFESKTLLWWTLSYRCVLQMVQFLMLWVGLVKHGLNVSRFESKTK